ncbi:unnamed protein product [Dimorphilus gyrociliatus]|uniref:Histone H2A n=1 Tax=Dimorphilus gyrociliatus TaxID=2664684 RepID=A0A7I8W5B2_9ANNE|nr:unnamed protein product [Dimorphilus gyrociliatus]
MRGKGGKKKVSNRRTKSQRAGLLFSVGRIEKKMRKYYGKKFRLSSSMPVYTAAVIEYLNAEVLELAGNCCKEMKKKIITPRHLFLAIAHDFELDLLLKNVTISSGGVLPKILPSLIKPNDGRKVHNLNGKAAAPSSAVKVKQLFGTSTVPLKRKVTGTLPATTSPSSPRISLSKKATTLLKKQTSNKKKQDANITILREKRLGGGQRLSVVSGDILDVKADALINPTNAKLYMGGQVGTAISKKGGPTLRRTMSDLRKSHGQLTLTDAVISPLDDNIRLIHCHGPTWSASGDDCSEQLKSTIFSCLKVAEENEVKSIAFPSVGSGKAGIPKQMAAETILAAINEYFASNEDSGIEEIYFVLFDEESQACYMYELGRL